MTLNIYYDPSAPNNQRKVWTPGVSDGFVYGKDGGIGGSTGTWGADPNAPVVQVAAAVQQPIAHLQFSISPIGQPIPLAMGWCRLPGQVIWTDGIKSAPAPPVATVRPTEIFQGWYDWFGTPSGPKPAGVGVQLTTFLGVWTQAQLGWGSPPLYTGYYGNDTQYGPTYSGPDLGTRVFLVTIVLGWPSQQPAPQPPLGSTISIACSFCEPIDLTEGAFIQSMSVGGITFWDRAITPDSIIDQAALTQGEMQQLRDCVNSIRVYWGFEDQGVDPTIEKSMGVGNAPAFRGMRYAVFKNMPSAIFKSGVPSVTIEFRTSSSQINVSDVFTKLAATRGISLDAAAILTTCKGYVTHGQQSIVQILRSHADLLNFRIIDGDPIILSQHAVDSSLVVDSYIGAPDLKRRTGATIIYTRQNPRDIPFEIRVQYSDPSNSYDTTIQPAAHHGDTSSTKIATISTEFVLDASIARGLAFDTLYRLRSQSLSLDFETDEIGPQVGDVLGISKTAIDTGTPAVLGPELLSDTFFATALPWQFDPGATWSVGHVNSIWSGTAPNYPDFWQDISLVSGTSYQLEVHQAIIGDDSFLYFFDDGSGLSSSISINIGHATVSITDFVADFTGSLALDLDFWNYNVGATRDVTFVSLKEIIVPAIPPVPTDPTQVTVCVVDAQTATSRQTNAIKATALLTSTGIEVAGAAGAAGSSYIKWPEDCVNGVSLVADGRIWSNNFNGMFSVDTAPNPYSRLPDTHAFIISIPDVAHGGDGSTFLSGIFCMADDANYVYMIDQNATVTRFSKGWLPDYQFLNLGINLAGGSTPFQCVIYQNKLYFPFSGAVGADTRAIRLGVLDLANFSTAGFSYYDIVNKTLNNTDGLIGIAIVGGVVIVAGGSFGKCFYISGIESISTFWRQVAFPLVAVGDPYFFGKAATDGVAAYFTPRVSISNPSGSRAKFARVTPDGSITLYSITLDPNALAMGGIGLRPLPCFDGTNFCFSVNSGNFPYLFRFNTASLSVSSGIPITTPVPFQQDAAGFGFEDVLFSDGYYYFPGDQDFVIIKADETVANYYPRPSTAPPLNDPFSLPAYLVPGDSVISDNSFATVDSGEQTIFGSIHTGHSLWWIIEVGADGNYSFRIDNPFFNPIMQVFEGETLSTLSLMWQGTFANTDFAWYLLAGVRYHVRVALQGTTGGGLFTLSVSEVVVPVLDDDDNFLMVLG